MEPIRVYIIDCQVLKEKYETKYLGWNTKNINNVLKEKYQNETKYLGCITKNINNTRKNISILQGQLEICLLKNRMCLRK